MLCCLKQSRKASLASPVKISLNWSIYMVYSSPSTQVVCHIMTTPSKQLVSTWTMSSLDDELYITKKYGHILSHWPHYSKSSIEGKEPNDKWWRVHNRRENVLKELYKPSEMMTQTKLFKQFNKLLNHFMDEDTKRDHKLPLRNWQNNWSYIRKKR